MSVVTKNPYDLLGAEDGDAPKVVKAPVAAKTDKAAAPKRSGNDAAFRDRNAGADRNRGKPTDEAARGNAPRGGAGARVRGGRGGRFPRDRDDRHSKGLPSSTEKNTGGYTEGEAEKRDEEAGEDIAKNDESKAAAEEAAAVEEAEPEEVQISYDDYLAQQAEKKLALEAAAVALRQANEGTKANKQWASAKPLVKDDDEEFIAGSGGKAKRERERKVKQIVEIDQRFVEQAERPRGGARGGRGGAPRGGDRAERGGRPERGDRPERGERSERGRGGPRGGARGRGEPRGGAPRGGAPRGGAAPRSGPTINPKDESAFPSLGA